MKVAIRYYSRFGHSATMAGVVSEVTGTRAESLDVGLEEPVDTLYLGSGVFLGKISSEMVRFIMSLSPEKVKRVVCFASCAIIKSPVPQMRELLEQKGITVDGRSFVCRGSMGLLHRGHPDGQDLENLRLFVQSTI